MLTKYFHILKTEDSLQFTVNLLLLIQDHFFFFFFTAVTLVASLIAKLPLETTSVLKMCTGIDKSGFGTVPAVKFDGGGIMVWQCFPWFVPWPLSSSVGSSKCDRTDIFASWTLLLCARVLGLLLEHDCNLIQKREINKDMIRHVFCRRTGLACIKPLPLKTFGRNRNTYPLTFIHKHIWTCDALIVGLKLCFECHRLLLTQ